MKKISICFGWILLIVFSGTLSAQQFTGKLSVLPTKAVMAPSFGKDIVISDQPDQNQQSAVICSAYNGWLYAAYWYSIPIDKGGMLASRQEIKIMKSTDDGMTWTELTTIELEDWNARIETMDIVTTGQTISDIKVILGYIWSNNSAPYWGAPARVARYNGTTGAFENYLFQTTTGIAIIHLALASDVNYPALSSGPNSLALLLSKQDQWAWADSITVLTSSNGGISFDGHKTITGVGLPWYQYRRVSLAYGYSPSYNSGRYYAVWEQEAPGYLNYYNIYSAYSSPNFNSPFTVPIRLDSLDPATTTICRNPVVSCQHSTSDNDSSNITEVVVFEKYIPAGNRWELAGCYNLQSASSDHFNTFSISNNTNLLLQPDICFNPYNSAFYLTYYDSTGSKLPLVEKGVNMQNPDSWNSVSTDYHDLFTLASPGPKVGYNPGKQDMVNVWTAKQSNGKRAALFDAPYSIYTGISQNKVPNEEIIVSAFPNPSSLKVSFSFELKNSEAVKLSLFNLLGQQVKIICNEVFPSGIQTVTTDISSLPNGIYIYLFEAGDQFKVGKSEISR